MVNGQKTWTTLAQHADWIFCLVRTDPAVKKQSGISFLLIDMRSPGIEVRPIRTLDGGAEVNEVWFDEVRVPAENLVGKADLILFAWGPDVSLFKPWTWVTQLRLDRWFHLIS